MLAEKSLALGEMPQEATPDTWLAAGPWCFAGREELFPDWEKEYDFAPEPLADPNVLNMASAAAQALCVAVMPEIGAILCGNSSEYPDVYWQTLLSPWCIDVSRQIIERTLRCKAMVEKWGHLSLSVPILPGECSFPFVNEHDFTLRGNLGIDYNHWLFSRILESMWPKAWQKIVLPPRGWPEEGNTAESFVQKSRTLARRFLLGMPFPRLKAMTFRQSCKYSFAIAHPCRHADMSANLIAEFSRPELLKSFCLPDEIKNIFVLAIPLSIRSLKHPRIGKPARKPRLRVASVVAMEDAHYRQKLAVWRARGNRLAFVQHGGNYGQVRTACEACVTEYSQDIFFTWGWDKYKGVKGNFVPMPYPQIASIANSWAGANGNELIFVGTEMAAYGYRLDSHPTPLQFTDYRASKARFLEELAPELRARVLYRPYFSLPGTLSDAKWLLARFPDLKICSGNLLTKILHCRLAVLDHHGTTMLEALAANVPLILYWNRKTWLLTEECDKLLDRLRAVGVWHASPEEAARQARKVWKDPLAWWSQPAVQDARNSFCRKYALLPEGNVDNKWTETLKKL